jgi:hypothetical protein
MAHTGQLRYSRLIVYWLILSAAKVRLETGLAQQHRESALIPTRGAPPPASPCELSFPVLLLLAGQEFRGLLLRWPAWQVQRRRGGRRKVRREHHHHSPATSLRPPHRLGGDRRQAPSLISSGPLLTHSLSAREIIFVVKGAGVYLALIYLQTIEKNPGPPTTGFDNNQKVYLDEMCAKLNAQITASVANIVSAQLAPLLSRLDHHETELKELREVNSTQHTRITHLERHIRRNNLVIFGVPDNVQPEAALSKIATERFGLEAPAIESAYRFGKQQQNRPRPILVKLNNQQDKQKIMAKVSLLKGSRLVINDDLTPEEQATRRTILGAARAAKDKGIVCKVRRTGLLVNDNLIPAAELCKEAWMNEERSSVADAAGALQPPKRTSEVIRTPPGSQASTSNQDFWGAAPTTKKDKKSGHQHQSRSSSRNRHRSK